MKPKKIFSKTPLQTSAQSRRVHSTPRTHRAPGTLCIVAGGSGGHITPALVLAQQWKNKNPDGYVLFFGTNKKIDKQIMGSRTTRDPITIYKLPVSCLPGKKIWLYPFFFIRFFAAFFKSLRQLRVHKPCKIITTGGMVAIPVCLAGFLLSIPIELYELNVVPGKAIRLLSRFTKTIFVTFKKTKTFLAHAQPTNYPLRFCPADKAYEKEELLDTINKIAPETPSFSPTRKTIFVLGGSQGSLALNNAIKQWVKITNPSHVQIIHQTGSIDKTDWIEFYKNYAIPAYPFSYTDSLQSLQTFYLLADLIITRAGAGTLFELEFFQKRSIIVPLQNHASNHQVENAAEMVKQYPGLFVVHDQTSLLPSFIHNHLFSNVEK